MSLGDGSGSLALDCYLRELRALPRLGPEEERQLAERAAAGDRQARDRLMEAHLPFVVSVARRYRHHGLPLEDLVSEGNLGLLAAVGRYDATKGVRFLTYAVWWIRHAILKALHEKGRMIRLPAHQLAELSALGRVRELLRAECGHEPGRSELARALKVDEEHVERLLELGEDTVSLDAPLGHGDDAGERGDLLADARSMRGDEEALARLVEQELRRALQRLTPREARVVEEHFGLDGQRRRSLDEIGTELRLARERVRQIECHALRKLRRSALAQRLRDHVPGEER